MISGDGTKKVLILKTNNLSKELKKVLKDSFEVFVYNSFSKIKEINPDIVITDKLTKNSLKLLQNKYLIYISSKIVFSNGIYDTSIEPAPIDPTGKKKYEEEKLAKKIPNHLIIRVSDIIDENYIKKITEKIKNKEEISLDNKEQIYPVRAIDVAKINKTLIEIEARRVIHIRGISRTTFYKIGLIIAEMFKTTIDHIKCITEDKDVYNVRLLGIVYNKKIRQILKEIL